MRGVKRGAGERGGGGWAGWEEVRRVGEESYGAVGAVYCVCASLSFARARWSDEADAVDRSTRFQRSLSRGTRSFPRRRSRLRGWRRRGGRVWTSSSEDRRTQDTHRSRNTIPVLQSSRFWRDGRVPFSPARPLELDSGISHPGGVRDRRDCGEGPGRSSEAMPSYSRTTALLLTIRLLFRQR